MSTKMLREMLSQYEDMIGTSTSEIGTGALAEIEAIEEAAQAACDTGATAHMRERGHGVSAVVLQKIARDAP